tara:strand:+ start:144 stop:1421 length:1278 start_codon:yes stop_codon:yes gene_type:complete
MYSNGTIKSVIIDPTNYRVNSRAEFKLDGDRLYKTDLKLVNVGVNSATVTPYNKLAGVAGIVKRVALLDGKTELDSCNECHRYYAFKQLLAENAGNESMSRYLVHNGQGLRTSEQDKKLVNLVQPANLTNDPTTTPEGTIDLRDMLPLLRSMDLLDASKTFPNLRLQVEFETDDRLKVSDVSTLSSTLEPLLLADVIEDPTIMASMQKGMPSMVQFNKVEHDMFHVPQAKADNVAVTATTQTVNKKVRGFDNKRIGRLLAIKTYSNKDKSKTTNAIDDIGDMGSIACYDEIFNVRVNGKNILARKGNDKAPNARLAMLCDAYGDMASYFGSNLISIAGNEIQVADGFNKTGRLDYFGLVVNETVQDLQISYDRTHLPSANGSAGDAAAKALAIKVKANVGLDIHLYGEVAKVLSISPNGYNVAYV